MIQHINIQTIKPPIDKNSIINKVEKSARKAFENIDKKYLEDDNAKLTPSQIYDKINKLASERKYQNKKISTLPLPLPPPKTILMLFFAIISAIFFAASAYFGLAPSWAPQKIEIFFIGCLGFKIKSYRSFVNKFYLHKSSKLALLNSAI